MKISIMTKFDSIIYKIKNYCIWPFNWTEDRLCTNCKATDDEVHLVMICTAQNRFTRPRQLMFKCPGFTNITKMLLINMVNIRGHL